MDQLNNIDIAPDQLPAETWDETFGTPVLPEKNTQAGVVPLSVGNDGRLVAGDSSTPPAAIILPASVLEVEGAGWVFSGTFSASDADTVAWGAGTLTTEAGDAYSIGASNTGNMAAKTYIYFDVDVSETAFQTTTTAANSVGTGKILIAVAQNATGEAKYMVMNDNQYNIDAANIVANSITANELSTSITYAGSIVVDTAGNIRSGQTAFNTGTGWFIGNDSGTAKLSIGTPTGNHVTWDGSNLEVVGDVVDVQTFTSTDTWEKPTYGSYALVRMWGGGASGARGASEVGFQHTGGGGGEYAEKLFLLSALGSTETVTIGAGGAAKATTGNGNNGGDSTFGSHLTAGGGKAGIRGNTGDAQVGGAGGDSISFGTPYAGSGASGSEKGIYSGGGGAVTTTSAANAGGKSIFGGAGGGSVTQDDTASAGGTSKNGGGNGGAGSGTSGVNGVSGTVPGGGGGAWSNAADNASSGAGAAGYCVVIVF